MSVTVVFSNNQIRAVSLYLAQHNRVVNRTDLEWCEAIEYQMKQMVRSNQAFVYFDGAIIVSTDEYDNAKGDHLIEVDVYVDPNVNKPVDVLKCRI